MRTGCGADRVLVAAGGGDPAQLAGPCAWKPSPRRLLVVDARSGIAFNIVRGRRAAAGSDVTYEDIGGLDDPDCSGAIVRFFNHPELYRQFGHVPKAFSCGPPGSGKTLIAKAVAGTHCRSAGASTFPVDQGPGTAQQICQRNRAPDSRHLCPCAGACSR